MKMINKSKKYIILAVLLILLGTGITLAWLSLDGSEDTKFKPGDFTISTNFYDGEAIDSNKLSDEKGVYHLNGLTVNDYNNVVDKLEDDEKNDKHMNNLTININVEAKIAGYLRVKVMDEWLVTRTYPQLQNKKVKEVIFIEKEYEQNGTDVFFPFVLADGWVYDEATEYCYYENIIDGNTIIPFITGGINYRPKDSVSFYEICEVNVSSIAEMVQANRFEQLWGITEIPKEVSNG